MNTCHGNTILTIFPIRYLGLLVFWIDWNLIYFTYSYKAYDIYALILSRINYGILLWGYNSERIYKLQKKAMRIISLQKYNAHTEPLFKTFQLLKVNDILKVQQLRFHFSLIYNKLPVYFNCFTFSQNYHFHNHFTRLSNHFHVAKVNHTFATKCLR